MKGSHLMFLVLLADGLMLLALVVGPTPLPLSRPVHEIPICFQTGKLNGIVDVEVFDASEYVVFLVNSTLDISKCGSPYGGARTTWVALLTTQSNTTESDLSALPWFVCSAYFPHACYQVPDLQPKGTPA